MSKYAPAREDQGGAKPYVVTVSSFGKSNDWLVLAWTASDAVHRGKGGVRHTYAKARRATPDDVERLDWLRSEDRPKAEGVQD